MYSETEYSISSDADFTVMTETATQATQTTQTGTKRRLVSAGQVSRDVPSLSLATWACRLEQETLALRQLLEDNKVARLTETLDWVERRNEEILACATAIHEKVGGCDTDDLKHYVRRTVRAEFDESRLAIGNLQSTLDKLMATAHRIEAAVGDLDRVSESCSRMAANFDELTAKYVYLVEVVGQLEQLSSVSRRTRRYSK